MSRTGLREKFDQLTRLALLENDADEAETRFRSMADDMKAIKTYLLGILISVTTASIVLAINATLSALHR